MKFIILPTSKCTNQWHVAHCHSCAAAPLSDFQPPSSPADTHLYSSGPPPDRPLHPASSPAAPAPARVRVSRTVQEVALGAWLLSLSMESSWLVLATGPVSELPSFSWPHPGHRTGGPTTFGIATHTASPHVGGHEQCCCEHVWTTSCQTRVFKS